MCLLLGRGVCAGAASLRVEHLAVWGSWRSAHHLGHAQQGHPRHALQPYWRYIYVYVMYQYRKSTPWWQISCLVACRVADPDPIGSGSIGSGSRRAKMSLKSRKKWRNFMFWSAGCSLLVTEGFFCKLDVLYVGLGIGVVNCSFYLKKYNIFSAVNFSNF